jgi:hypothetical protein
MSYFAINDEFLQQLETLELIVKNNVAGSFGGNHQSKSFGSSCEYADFRDYIPGDDITKIDWNAYARFEHLYLKQYLDERRLHNKIYIDSSRSMGFNKSNKAIKALQIAAAFAYISVVMMDKVSLYYIKDNTVYDLALNIANKDQFYNEIMKLNEIDFDGDFSFSEAILPTNVGYGDGLSVVVSDFLTENDFERGFDYLVSKKRDVVCCQVLATNELKPMVNGKMHMFDSENIANEYRKHINKDVLNAYREAVNYIIGSMEDFCSSRNATYILCEETRSVNDIFMSKLIEKGVLK